MAGRSGLQPKEVLSDDLNDWIFANRVLNSIASWSLRNGLAARVQARMEIVGWCSPTNNDIIGKAVTPAWDRGTGAGKEPGLGLFWIRNGVKRTMCRSFARLTLVLVITTLFCVQIDAQRSDGPTYITSPITADTTFTQSGSPYVVQINLTIPSTVTLTVQPGVEVKFDGNYALTVQGTLSAVGTASSLIVFTSAKASPAAGDWVGVHVSSTTLLRFVKISYADAGVWCEGPGNAARLEACTFTDNGSGIYLANQSTPVITRDAATSTGCTITKNQHGIYIALVGPNSMPQPDISYNSFLDNTMYDVYTQYYYDNSAMTINARNNWWGTTDVGTIASHIHDYTDNAACPVVDFNGFLDKAGGAPSTVTLVSGRVLTAATWQVSKSPVQGGWSLFWWTAERVWWLTPG